MNQSTKYDYIIAGGGLAGMLLAAELSKSPALRSKKILMVDKVEKNDNDRTWCFWTDHESWLDTLVYKSWNNIRFSTTKSDGKYPITPYKYKYIRGVDFYSYVEKLLAEAGNTTRLLATITEVSSEGFIVADGIRYEADIVFNSLHPPMETFKYPKEKCYYLLQHFKGYFIKTEEDYFEDDCATFMDFSIEQHKEARFGYILPFSKRDALVEYTLFSQNLLSKEQYIAELENYIAHKLGIKKYSIYHEEFGIVPMSTYDYEPKQEGNVVRIGTYGGFVKPSSGFAFYRTYKRIKEMVASLEHSGKISPQSLESPSKYKLYDNILMSILEKDNTATKDIFEKMFLNMPAPTILRFLDEESSFGEDLQLMSKFVTDKRFFNASMTEVKKMLLG